MRTGSTTTPEETTLRGYIENLPDPAELRDLRLAALAAYERSALPDPRHESWRKIRLDHRGFDPRSFQIAESGGQVSVTNPHGDTVRVLDFAGALAATDDGALAKVLREHLAQQQARIEPALTAQADMPEPGDPREAMDIFQLQNLACHGRATLVAARAATPATKIEPVRICHTTGGNALVQRTLIYAAPGAEITVVEEFGTPPEPGRDAATAEADAEASLWNCETYIVCGDNARVNYVSLRHYRGFEYNFHRIESNQGRDTRVHVSVAQHGGYAGKSFVTGRLGAPGGEFRGIGVAAASGSDYLDMEMLVSHEADHTNSSLLYKSVVNDRGHSVFNGNLWIPPGRKHVDSHQTNNNILLNKKARAESMPKLIVRAEDVSAEHGATVGELDNEAIFFLMSRGLSEGEARVMLIEGFLMQVIAEMPVPDLHEQLLSNWKAKLSL